MSAVTDEAIEILQATNDGDDLAPEDLKLLELGVNGFLNEAGDVAFGALVAKVREGYQRPWFHGIEHLTLDHVGYVYWKGQQVEHYTIGTFAYTDRGVLAAKEVARRCRALERAGEAVSTRSVIWDWSEEEVPA